MDRHSGIKPGLESGIPSDAKGDTRADMRPGRKADTRPERRTWTRPNIQADSPKGDEAGKQRLQTPKPASDADSIQDMPEAVSEAVPEEEPNDVSEEVHEDMPEDMPEDGSPPQLDYVRDFLAPPRSQSYCSILAPHIAAYAKSLHPDVVEPMAALTEEEWHGFAQWFVDYAKERTWGSFQIAKLRPAIRWYFKGMFSKEEIELAANFTPGKVEKPGHDGRRQRNRKPDARTLRDLFARLREEADISSRELTLALLATLACGARYAEWYGASFEDTPGGGILTLSNAKYDGNLRGNANQRHLFYMGEENERSVRVIRSWLERLDELYKELGGHTRENYLKIHLRLRMKLYKVQCRVPARAQRDTLARTVNLYSMRHLFAARMKKKAEEMGYDKNYVAALMGHAVNESAWRHYTDQAIAMGGIGKGPLPLTKEQAMVRLALAKKNLDTSAPKAGLPEKIEASAPKTPTKPAQIRDETGARPAAF